MIRILKVLILVALAVSALGAISASAAQAATFRTTPPNTLTTQKDGTTKTAHQVFEIKNGAGTATVSFTCNEIEGDATVSGTSTEDVTLVTPQFTGCTASGQPVTVTNTGCNFTFTAGSPQLHIVSEAGKECKHGKQSIDIDFNIGTAKCHVEIGEQTISGIVYHNIEEGSAKLVTTEATNIEGITYNAEGELCSYGTTSNGKYTTGNAVVTAEEKGTTNMINIEWTSEA